jgi:predicted metal-dependent hydrolase
MSNSDSKAAFKERVGYWAGKLDVAVVWLGVRPMSNKWASCSTRVSGHLNFNADLLDLKTELWDYVIVHELLHFFIPNHGKLWKSLMRAHLGEYEAYEAELKQIAHDRRFPGLSGRKEP